MSIKALEGVWAARRSKWTQECLERLEKDIAWLKSREQFWRDKENEFRTKPGPIPVSDVHTYSLIRFAKHKRKKYQQEVKEAQEKLAKGKQDASGDSSVG